jgi:amino acid transporter/nucleotide-binding universal stress UspA family protein
LKKPLKRSLGLYSATMVSVGSMIGGAIFVLAGTVFKISGPSATLAILLAGVATLMTSFSFAEFSTFVPEAGGGYSYVRAVFGNKFIGFFTGWILWIGYALSASLFAIGFGSFLHYFIPFLPEIIGSVILIVYLTSNQISGIKNSALLQNTIVTIFVSILVVYIIYGFKFADFKNVTPFFSQGFAPMFQAMSILYMTYIGFDAVTTLGEEVKNPKKTIPLAIMISMVVVLIVKTLAFFIGSAILNVQTITAQNAGDFMINTAKVIGGPFGGYIFAAAGILATLSCMNTSLLASSRTSFALSRDKKLPYFFQSVNPKTQSPIFSIVMASIIILVSTITQNVEEISIIASSLTLAGYTFINLSLLYSRKRKLNTQDGFKAPLYPYIQIFAIAFNIAMIFILLYADRLALGFVIAFVGIGIVYYLLNPKLKTAPKGISNEPLPSLKTLNTNKPFNLLLIVEDEDKAGSLLKLGSDLTYDGKILPIGIVDVPGVINEKTEYDHLKSSIDKFERIKKIVSAFDEKNLNFSVVVSKDRESVLEKFANENKISMIMMTWKEDGHAFTKWEREVIERSQTDVGVVRMVKDPPFKKILFPYSGSIYSQMAAATVKKIANAYKDSEITILKIVYEESESQIEEYKKILSNVLKTIDVSGKVLIEYSPSAWQKIVELSADYDLVVLGISTDWNVGDRLLGLKTDLIFEESKSSVLVVRAFHGIFHNQRFRKLFEFIKKFAP